MSSPRWGAVGWQVGRGQTWVCEPGALGLGQALPPTDNGQSHPSKPQFTPL